MDTETGQGLIKQLRETRPDIAIKVSREFDSSFSWDGDGPDPAEEGYLPYTVTVSAYAIRQGTLIAGESSLGGSYFKPDEKPGEIHGYLKQMVEEAVEELDSVGVTDGERADIA